MVALGGAALAHSASNGVKFIGRNLARVATIWMYLREVPGRKALARPYGIPVCRVVRVDWLDHQSGFGADPNCPLKKRFRS